VLFLFVHRAFSRQENGWNHQKTIHGVKHLIVSGTLLAACVPTLGWARIQNAREVIHQETGLPLESIRVGYQEPESPPGATVATSRRQDQREIQNGRAIALIRRMVQMMSRQNAVDQGHRQKVAIDAITTALTW
jgi:hypothetical protein